MACRATRDNIRRLLCSRQMSGRLLAALQFQLSLKQEGSTSLATWLAHSDSRQDHHRAVSESLRPPGDCRRPRGRHIPRGWGGLMPTYSRHTSASTQPGGRPMIACSLVMYHRHGNTPLEANYWRKRQMKVKTDPPHAAAWSSVCPESSTQSTLKLGISATNFLKQSR